MDWNNIITVISELVKDDTIRFQIYKRLLDASDYVDKDIIEEDCIGYDSAYDEVWEQYSDLDEDEELFEEDDDYERDDD